MTRKGSRKHSTTWAEFRFTLGLACLLMCLVFAGFESLAHSRNGILWIALGAAGALYFWIHLPQGGAIDRDGCNTSGRSAICWPVRHESLSEESRTFLPRPDIAMCNL